MKKALICECFITCSSDTRQLSLNYIQFRNLYSGKVSHSLSFYLRIAEKHNFQLIVFYLGVKR